MSHVFINFPEPLLGVETPSEEAMDAYKKPPPELLEATQVSVFFPKMDGFSDGKSHLEMDELLFKTLVGR